MSDVPGAQTVDLICLSHLRWNFVFQRPQHLLTRCALERRCFYCEEPVYDADRVPRLDVQQAAGGVTVAVPHLPVGCSAAQMMDMQRVLIDELIAREEIDSFVLWYY